MMLALMKESRTDHYPVFDPQVAVIVDPCFVCLNTPSYWHAKLR